jgi:hypothetical protein
MPLLHPGRNSPKHARHTGMNSEAFGVLFAERLVEDYQVLACVRRLPVSEVAAVIVLVPALADVRVNVV